MAAEEDTSIRAHLAARLEPIVGERKIYDRARKRARARLLEDLGLGRTPPQSLEELHCSTSLSWDSMFVFPPSI
jgi:hypothetical protein